MKICLPILCTMVVFQNVSLAQGVNKDFSKHLFLGGEFGFNKIRSDKLHRRLSYFSPGISLEYFLNSHLSLLSGVKQFDVGVSYDEPDTISYLFGHPEIYGNFMGRVISAPIQLKYQGKIIKSIYEYFTIGIGYNHELESIYWKYSDNTPDFKKSKNYMSTHWGFGFSYLKKRTNIFLEIENYRGVSKGEYSYMLYHKTFRTKNTLIQIGSRIRLD